MSDASVTATMEWLLDEIEAMHELEQFSPTSQLRSVDQIEVIRPVGIKSTTMKVHLLATGRTETNTSPTLRTETTKAEVHFGDDGVDHKKEYENGRYSICDSAITRLEEKIEELEEKEWLAGLSDTESSETNLRAGGRRFRRRPNSAPPIEMLNTMPLLRLLRRTRSNTKLTVGRLLSYRMNADLNLMWASKSDNPKPLKLEYDEDDDDDEDHDDEDGDDEDEDDNEDDIIRFYNDGFFHPYAPPYESDLRIRLRNLVIPSSITEESSFTDSNPGSSSRMWITTIESSSSMWITTSESDQDSDYVEISDFSNNLPPVENFPEPEVESDDDDYVTVESSSTFSTISSFSSSFESIPWESEEEDDRVVVESELSGAGDAPADKKRKLI